MTAHYPTCFDRNHLMRALIRVEPFAAHRSDFAGFTIYTDDLAQAEASRMLQVSGES